MCCGGSLPNILTGSAEDPLTWLALGALSLLAMLSASSMVRTSDAWERPGPRRSGVLVPAGNQGILPSPSLLPQLLL